MKRIIFFSVFILSMQLYAIEETKPILDSIPAISKYLEGNIETSDFGFVNIYEKDNRFLLEIPENIIGRDILTTITIIKGAQNNNRKLDKKFGYGDDSMHEKMVRFQKKGDVINIVSPDIKHIEKDNFVFSKYYESLISPIIQAFPIKAQSDGNYLIDITDYYLSDNELFALAGVRTELELGGYNPQRSYSTEIVSYPTNINFRSVRSYSAAKPQESTYPNTLWEIGASWILLPESPMQIRPFDQRVGYFATNIMGQKFNSDYDTETFLIANRWRLEPKPEDLNRYLKGELVEPKKPIVFYIDKNMPEYLVPYAIDAVGNWQTTFEKAGFKNAIYALPEPTKEENPDYSPDDARYSLISYKASPVPNAYGPLITDPRSGEIIASHVAIFHTVTDLVQMWYFSMCSPSDPEARVYPVGQDLMGKLVRTVISHEIGHTLGLRHNFMGSTNYAVDSLRSNKFIEKHGLGSSIMDYQRFNNVAQPEDHVKQDNLFPVIGDYDEFAIEWGYRFYPETSTAELVEIQNAWVKKELKKGNRDYIVESTMNDPRVQAEDSGDDIVYASRLAMKNLQYILKNLEDWTLDTDQTDYVLLQRRYLYVLQQYQKYIGHIMNVVGGYYTVNNFCSHHNYVDEYKAVSYQEQKEALEFLEEYMLCEPTWLTKPSFMNNIDVNLEERVYTPLKYNITKLLLKGTNLKKAQIVEDNPMTYEKVQNSLLNHIFVNKKPGEKLSYYERILQSSYLTQLTINIENQANLPLNINQFLQSQIYKIKDLAERKNNQKDTFTKAHYLGILNFIKIWEQGNQKL